MTQYSKAIALFLSAGFLLTGTISLNAQQRKGLKKGPNVSLNITNKKKEPHRTYFNLGLFSNFASSMASESMPSRASYTTIHMDFKYPDWLT